ncbi:endolytic transglycosylase MltG [Pseudidiomarina gelatinasegens]|uniref:endolytic transglycosylase MltG n=1 Tax=Pseudidiomarina gelatinasegens TaxID=2487740 RepID=UPI003A96FF35
MVFKRFIQFLIAASVIALAICVFLIWYGFKQLQQPLGMPEPLLFEVKRGMHARTIISQLNSQGAQLQVTPTYLASRILDKPERLQAGVYQVMPEDTVKGLWQKLRNGEQYQFRVALVEGRTLFEWLQQLQQSDHLKQTLQNVPRKELNQQLASHLNVEMASFEGQFFPDTYNYTAGTKDIDILKQAFQRMQGELSTVWASRDADLPYENAFELLIMASIIEKETGLSGERKRVSSVFINRLRAGMRLQSDPTTIYGIDDFDGNLTRAHLREQTAYNTYRINGLPPTPIAMPSLSSLEAAAHPETTDYFYFVADGSGGHVFSKTLAEHNRAVNKYQRNQD